MRIRVVHNIGDLASDLAAIPPRAGAAFAQTVRSNTERGNRLAKQFARAKAGRHGLNYYKRLTAEMTGPLTGEYGPEGIPKTDFVGVGFRSGANLDLPNSADIIGPKFADELLDAADGFFW